MFKFEKLIKFSAMALVLLFVTLILPVRAEDIESSPASIPPEKKQVISEILELSDIDVQIDRMWNRTLSRIAISIAKVAMRDAAKKGNLSKAEQIAEAKEVTGRVMKNLKERFEKTYHHEYLKIYEGIYDQCFNLEELKELRAFYASDTGKKTTKEVPLMVKDLVKDLHKQLDPKIKACLKKRLDAMNAEAAPVPKI